MRVNFILGHAFPVPAQPGAGIAPVEARCWELAAELAARGHEVALYSRTWPGLRGVERYPSGVEVVRIPGHRWTRRKAVDLANALRYGARLLRCVREADVHVCKTFFFPFLARAAGRPRGAICVGLHREPKPALKAYAPLLMDGAGRGVHFTAVSEFVRRGAERVCPPMKGRVAVVPNPVDLRTFSPGERGWDAPTILYAGRLVPEKGLADLAEAFALVKAECSSARLRLVGPLRAGQNSDEGFVGELRRRFARHAWGGDVRFVGLKGPAALAQEYRRAWVVCYPSVAGEACPNVVLEAMACATPVVTSDFGPFPELFTHGCEGFQVPARSPRALADGLLRVLEDRTLRERLGTAARDRASQFSLERIARRYMLLFEELLSR